MTLIDSAGAVASIEAPAPLTEAEAQAVGDFHESLKTMAGVKPKTTPPLPGRIVLERTDERPASPREAEAFSISARNGVLRLRAKTSGGIVQGIYWFLRAHGGVRWYVPGEPAAAPLRRPWALDDFSETPEPSFESRILYGLAGREGALWGRRNGLGNPIAFSHNLARVITPDLLRQNPEWRCVFAGVRTPAAQARFYQPELQRESLADSAAQTAADFFAKDPSAFSFSLGLDDNTRFSQSDDALRARGPLRFYRGLPDYSDTVFTFMNRAGAALADSGHVQKRLGCLAYQWNVNAPSFSVSPNIVPFVASDRTFWHAEIFRRDEASLLQRWSASGVRTFGLYDYLYGEPFLIPRPLAQLPQWLKAGYAAGARAYFAEAFPAPEYDMQKLWVAAALLWDIDASPQKLADEWMSARYGKAARPVGEFFEAWESAWLTQVENPYWLRNYWDEAQGLLVSPQQLDWMAACLDAAAVAVRDEPTPAAAVAALKRRFALTDAFCRFVQKKAALSDSSAPRDTRATNRLYENLVAFLNARARWNALLEASSAATRAAAVQTERSDPSVGALLALAQRARSQGRLRTYLKSIQGIERHPGATPAFCDAYRALAQARIPAIPRNQLLNTDFEQPRAVVPADFNPLWPTYEGVLPAAWQLRALRNETLSVTLEGTASKRAKVLAVSGAENVHLFQWVTLPPGAPVFFSVQLKGLVTEGTQVFLILTWNDKSGVRRTREARLFPGNYPEGRTLWMTTPSFEQPTRCAMGVIVAHQKDDDKLVIAIPIQSSLRPIGPTYRKFR